MKDTVFTTNVNDKGYSFYSNVANEGYSFYSKCK